MKKRTLALAALTAAMTLGMSLTSFAAEEPTWLVPKDTPSYVLNQNYGTMQWWQAESVEQARAWAEANKGDIIGIQDEQARYTAIANKVCNFLTYDLNYLWPHIAYTIRDGRGVCADYTSLGKALCDACNIKAQISIGADQSQGAEHSMLVVTINGKEWYSDLTRVENGETPLQNAPMPTYIESYRGDRLIDATNGTGGDVEGSDSVLGISAPEGMTLLCSSTSGDYYCTIEDSKIVAEALQNDDDVTLHKIYDKYGVPYAK